MLIIDDDVEVLARAMIRNHPKDAADRAEMRSDAFFVMGYFEESEKWLRVSEEIKKDRPVSPEAGLPKD
jgi:hypothetical protein